MSQINDDSNRSNKSNLEPLSAELLHVKFLDCARIFLDRVCNLNFGSLLNYV